MNMKKIKLTELDESVLANYFDCANLKQYCNSLKLRLCEINNQHFVIAGGALRDILLNTHPHDIDMFAIQHHVPAIAEQFDKSGFKFICETKLSRNYLFNREKYQLISSKHFVRFRNNNLFEFAEKILKSFEFTINQIAYIPAHDVIIFSEAFVHDMHKKLIRPIRALNEYSHSQLFATRILKFMNK